MVVAASLSPSLPQAPLPEQSNALSQMPQRSVMPPQSAQLVPPQLVALLIAPPSAHGPQLHPLPQQETVPVVSIPQQLLPLALVALQAPPYTQVLVIPP